MIEEVVVEEDKDSCCLLFPQSFPFLDANAAKNLLLITSLFSFITPEGDDDKFLLQSWSAGNRCFKQTLIWQILQVLLLEKVKTSLHRLTGHLAFFIFAGSQSPDFRCFSNMSSSSFESMPVVSIATVHVSQIITLRLFWSGLGQSWDLDERCSTQNTCKNYSKFSWNSWSTVINQSKKGDLPFDKNRTWKGENRVDDNRKVGNVFLNLEKLLFLLPPYLYFFLF